ncbi:methyltransferase domain-containing protein [Blastomonas sp.]|uniref:class I SAM-dependent methyltransferase n=1 Tax=Blastomonas sp. TaxID=1909299 RepID=UPI00260BA69C|nr:methyltransferase domain-containing protein [Blastomonas sp.]MDM7957104.1 methyltransferase domain-containing protein [Blastomonas sp.]
MNLAIQTDAFWDQSVDGYIASAEPFTGLFCKDAVGLADIAPGMTLLDIATGPGALALAAARAGATVTAIDFSQAMIDRLRERAADSPITALRMNGEALDLPPDSYDRVCSVFGVPLFPDWRAGLAEMARVLKPAGRAVLGVAANPFGFGPNVLLARARSEVLPDHRAEIDIAAMEILCDAGRLQAEMEDAGFCDVTVHQRQHDFIMPFDLMATDHPMILQNPLVSALPPRDRDQVIARALEMASSLRQGDIISLPGVAHLAVASKR